MSVIKDLFAIIGGDDNDPNSQGGFLGIVNRIFNLDGDHSTSLTTVSRKTMVGSDVFIEGPLLNEDEIMVPLMGALSQIYVGYVLTALEIYQSVDRYTTISETVGRIATEALALSLETIDPAAQIKQDLSTTATIGQEAVRNVRFTNEIDDNIKHLAAGRLIEFEFIVDSSDPDAEHSSDGRGNTVTVPISVQMYPTFLPTEIAEALVELNYPERFWRRLAKVMAREIHFFRDFILCLDQVRKHREALKLDNNNVLARFYQSKFGKQFKRIYDIVTGRNRNNLANSILVITSDTFKRINDSASIDLGNYVDRQKFFNNAYAMMLVVVDLDYKLVTFYYNGISSVRELPFRAIKIAGSSKAGIDIQELMASIAKGSAPKF